MDKFTNYINPNDKIEILVSDENNKITRFFALYKGRQKENLIITIPQGLEEEFSAQSGQNLILNIYTKGGIFKVSCNFLFSDAQSCCLSLSDDFERLQRREYIRVNMPVNFELHLKSSEEYKKINARTRNISAKGLNANLQADISSYPKIEVVLNFGDIKIKTLSRAVKIKKISTKEGEFYNTSMEFIGISEKEIDYIVKKCFEYETSERRKMLNS